MWAVLRPLRRGVDDDPFDDDDDDDDDEARASAIIFLKLVAEFVRRCAVGCWVFDSESAASRSAEGSKDMRLTEMPAAISDDRPHTEETRRSVRVDFSLVGCLSIRVDESV